VRHFGRHANAFTQGRVRVNGFADVHRIRAHFNRQGDFANHVTGVRSHHAAAQDLAVAMGFGRVVKQQLGDALVPAVGDGAAGRCPSVHLEISNIFVIFPLVKNNIFVYYLMHELEANEEMAGATRRVISAWQGFALEGVSKRQAEHTAHARHH
jgi:hypothetical protein